MAEQTGTAEAQGAEVAPAQGAAAPAQGAATDAQGASGEESAQSVEALTAKIAALEKDNRSYRQREKAWQEQQKAQEQAGQSEAERLSSRVVELERELTDLRAQRQEQSLRLASVASAQKLGYRNPDLAYRLLDLSAVDYADDGTPRNIDKLLTELAKSDPYLLVQTDFGGGQRGSSASPSSSMNTLIRNAAGR